MTETPKKKISTFLNCYVVASLSPVVCSSFPIIIGARTVPIFCKELQIPKAVPKNLASTIYGKYPQTTTAYVVYVID